MSIAAETALSQERVSARPIFEEPVVERAPRRDEPRSPWWHGALMTVGATVGYAALHSLLASRAAKAAASRTVGERRRNALYRPMFNLQATAGFAALAWYMRRWPNCELYNIRGPAAWFMRATQAACLGVGFLAARQIGLKRVLGWSSMSALLAGHREVVPEPEAQGPVYDPEQGMMLATGPFEHSRHPLNFVPIPILWLNPRMTTNLAAFAAVATLYFIVGSVHEEHRLQQAYGQAYEHYRQSGVPFFLPH